MSRTSMKAAAGCLVAALFLSWFVPRQYAASQNANQTDAFTFLTSLYANQPDFTADAQVGGSRMKIARKNGKLRREWLNPSKSKHAVGGIYHNVLLELPGSPAIALDPQLKIYAEVPSEQTPPDVIRRMIESVKNDPQAQCKVEKLGTEMLDGHIVERTRMLPVSPGTDPGEISACCSMASIHIVFLHHQWRTGVPLDNMTQAVGILVVTPLILASLPLLTPLPVFIKAWFGMVTGYFLLLMLPIVREAGRLSSIPPGRNSLQPWARNRHSMRHCLRSNRTHGPAAHLNRHVQQRLGRHAVRGPSFHLRLLPYPLLVPAPTLRPNEVARYTRHRRVDSRMGRALQSLSRGCCGLIRAGIPHPARP